MKNTFFTEARIFAAACIAVAALAAGLSGCAEKELVEVSSGSGTGNLKIQVSIPQTKSGEGYDAIAYSTVRIYQIVRGSDDDMTENLVRRYKPASSIPSNLYLVAGEYRITVEAGTGDEATFTNKTYYGESTFTLEANKEKTVNVECKVVNSVVKVVFDETVRTTFDEGFRTFVSAADEFDRTAAENGTVPTLEYTSDNTGFFILPEGVSNLSWGFYGESSDADIEAKGSKTGVIENAQEGVQYTLTYKYSKDADGFLSMTVQVKEYENVIDDSFIFSPQPTITGNGFSFDETVAFYNESIRLDISAINPLQEIKFTVGDDTFNVMTGGEPSASNAGQGIELTETDENNAVLSLTPEFFANIGGGVRTFDFSVSDISNGEASAQAKIAVPGAADTASVDLWHGTGTIEAVVTNPSASDVRIKYRAGEEGEWTEVSATAGDNYIYTAQATGLTAGKSYQIQLVEDGIESGMTATVNTEPGSQVPNSDFEEWHKSGAASYPYAQGGTEFWGTGNPGATALGNSFNLTSESTDVRPGSAGKYSARLETKKPSIVGIGKLAAGNIFVGSFGEISGMGGTVNMGRAFEFNAKPKALRVWYKYTPVGTDKGRIFVALINMTDGKSTSHVVNTNKADNTTFSPDDEFLYVDKTDPATLQGHVIGYGDLMLETKVDDWTMMEIPITYREKYSEEKSNVLMITATASYRGDYFEGEVGSLMYLDDIEFVY